MTAAVSRLQAGVRGEVRDDPATRAIYATDASNHRVPPAFVAFPRDAKDIATLLANSVAAEIPVTSRGAGTNCAGNAIGPGVVMDFSRHMKGTPEIDPVARTARIQPGLVLDRLQEAAEGYGLLFGVDPSTHSRCTLGGMIGTNACGSHSVAWGTTADNVVSLDVVLADGTALTLGADDQHSPSTAPLARRLLSVRDAYLGDIRGSLGRFGRQISGYGLQYLLAEHGSQLAKAFVGSEGTCGIVTSAVVRLHDIPPTRALVVIGFFDEVAAATAAPDIVALGPLTVEGIDETVVRTSDLRMGAARRPELPRGRAWLLIEIGGIDIHEVLDRISSLLASAGQRDALGHKVLFDLADQRAFWAIRERGAGLASRSVEGREFSPGWEDAAVPPAQLGAYLRAFRALMAEHGRTGMVYGHFGEGCLHVRIDHDLHSASGRVAYRAFQEDAADLVVAYQGSLSGEHGDGRARSELLGRMYGDRVLAAFSAFKHAFDPGNVLNPGVLVDPDPLDAHLRAEHSTPFRRDLAFLYPDDDGDLSKALRRCTGVGACRKSSGGGMCPSYRATSEEMHSTRGRARVLAEMLDGGVVPDAWQSDSVHEALDLCLSCKACSSECPVGVDMATYKAEFLQQRYRHRIRPRTHYSMGWLPVWLAFARQVPRLANWMIGFGWAQKLAKKVGGIDNRRALPLLAEEPLSREFRRKRRSGGGDRVVLWLDTFTRAFSPEVARAAVGVLENAGYRVELAPPSVCCGLTWVSTGQLNIARRVMARSVRLLDRSGSGAPIVVLEPSCATALRHDAGLLLGDEVTSRVAGRIVSLAEVIADRLSPVATGTSALVQFHCHQRATFGTVADSALLDAVGVDVTSVDEGCCGLAGNFGFEDGHYDISAACAEQALLPAIRRHGPEPILADGYSCRLQIEQLSGRRAIHLAELLLNMQSRPEDDE